VSGDANFYRDLAYIFGAAVVGGFVARALKQPLILGYVLGGIVIGPFTPGPSIRDVHQFEMLAEIGVILLMYSIGIEFSLRDLLRAKWVALVGGPLGILFSILLGLGVGYLVGWPIQKGIALGAVVSVASTMVLSKFLTERGELRSPHGQVMISVTLVEDLAVVMLTVLLPSIGELGGGRLIAVLLAVGKSLLLLVPVVFVAFKIVPGLMKRVSRTGNQELYLLVAVTLGLATAAITQAAGLSLALGAFLAGIIVSESEQAHETLNHLLPIRDIFVALFFVTIGILVNPRVVWSSPLLLLTIVAMTILGKFVIWTLIVRLFRYPWRTALFVGLGLTQIGEFSFVLVRVARDAQMVSDDAYNATLAASVITILLNGLLMRALPQNRPELKG
jgi:CPA2 family monovalent cation:H+ antiporter-2